MENEEIWRDIAWAMGFYRVSSKGRVMSVDRVITSSDGRTWQQPAKVLKPDDSHNGGYLTVMLSIHGKAKRHLVHRLVASEFLENQLGRPEVNHVDGNKKNNRVENLEWISRQKNIDHAVSSLLINNKGESNPQAKLNESTVLRIRELAAQGLGSAEIAKATGATKRNIKNIVTGVSWRHLLNQTII